MLVETYKRKATEEDRKKLQALIIENKEVPMSLKNVNIDPDTFSPYVVYDGVRYDIGVSPRNIDKEIIES